jgi:hypothetical protein
LANLAEALKRLACNMHETLGANLNTLYMRLEREIAPSLHPAAWYYLQKWGTVLPRELRLCLRWRCGQVPTMHNLHKWGKSKSTACRLCGDPDETAGHAMLACPALSAQHTSRHHRAGRIILAAIEAGAMGGCIKCADLGSAENCKEDGVMHRRTFDKCSILTPAQKRRLKDAGTYSVPDIILHVPAAGRGLAEHIHIVEVKYCRDTNPDPTIAAATAQHAALVAELQKARRQVHLHVITLGVGGAIYAGMVTTAADLGIPKEKHKTLLKHLNLHAVESMTAVWGRRKQLLHANNCQPSRPRQGPGVT